MLKKLNVDKMFLDVCDILAQQSKCRSFQVCAISVRDGKITGTGLNGTPSKYINCCNHFSETFDRETHHAWSNVKELHAEQALVCSCLNSQVPLAGATIYLTLQPCTSCTKLLIAAKVKRIVYKRAYDKSDPESLEFARECGVEIIQHITE